MKGDDVQKSSSISTELEKKSVLYLRVSSEEQVDNFSLDTQEDICRREAEKRGYSVIEVFKEEGRSAKTIALRPELLNLLEYCRKNKGKVEAVFVYRIDRMSRQTSDYLVLRKKFAEYGVTIVSATEPTGNSPTEKLVETMLAGFAQLDNDIRGERARNGLRARFFSGLISSNAPLGYLKKDGYAVKDPKTFDKLKEAWDLMATGTTTLTEIAEIMNAWGIREICRGKSHRLKSQTAQRIFRQKFYMGIITSRKYPDEVRGQHVPMVTEEQFYKVQAILDGRNVSKSMLVQRNVRNTAFPLRRIIKCDQCGRGLTAGFSRGKTGARYGYYRCSTNCTTKSVKAELLEEALISVLKKCTPSTACKDLFLDCMSKRYTEHLGRLQKTRFQADDEINRLKELRKTLVKKNLEGVYSDEVFKEQNGYVEEKMIQAQIAKEDGKIEQYNMNALMSFVKTFLADLGETYKRSNVDQRKVLLVSMFPENLSLCFNGTLNYELSSIYQSIIHFCDRDVALGETGEDRTHDTELKRLLLYH